MSDDPKITTDPEEIREFTGGAVEIVSVSLLAVGPRDPLMPPILLVARAPGFDWGGVPGMGDSGSKASTCDWRWSVVTDEEGFWAVLELWWPGDIQRRLKVRLDKGTARNLFPMLAECAPPSGIMELGISGERSGIPTEQLGGVEIDLNDRMLMEITSWVNSQSGDPGHSG